MAETKKRKDNSRKHPQMRKQWIRNECANHPKQRWVREIPLELERLIERKIIGHREKIQS